MRFAVGCAQALRFLCGIKTRIVEGDKFGNGTFVSASLDGSRSVTVSVNLQITPKNNSVLFPELRAIDELWGLCSAPRAEACCG